MGIGFYERGVPVISVVHDLEFQAYPEFLTPELVEAGRTAFADACWLAERLVCSSGHVRDAAFQAGKLPQERVVTIAPSFLVPREAPNRDFSAATLAEVGLEPGQFLLYATDFRPKKNHSMLITAFGIYRAQHPQSPLKLACIGEPDDSAAALREAIQRMGVANSIILTERVTDIQRAALLTACRAIVYPSLYEGSGQPILDAMARGKPVLCSNTSALPEVVQDAGVYFDPRRPGDIVQAIESVTGDDVVLTLSAKVRARAMALRHEADEVIQEYLAVFHEVAQLSRRTLDKQSRQIA
jgi:glycosyltransferase involved in cell wall biosynthesis